MATISVKDADGNDYEMELPDKDGGTEPTNDDWAQLRQAKRATRDANEAAASAKREAAFLRAGINPDDTRMKYFYEGYKGDPDPEKIKAAAAEAGFLSAEQLAVVDPTKPPTADLDRAGLEAGQRISNASIGSVADERTAAGELEEAFKTGGDAAMMQYLAKQGVVIKYDGQN